MSDTQTRILLILLSTQILYYGHRVFRPIWQFAMDRHQTFQTPP